MTSCSNGENKGGRETKDKERVGGFEERGEDKGGRETKVRERLGGLDGRGKDKGGRETKVKEGWTEGARLWEGDGRKGKSRRAESLDGRDR